MPQTASATPQTEEPAKKNTTESGSTELKPSRPAPPPPRPSVASRVAAIDESTKPKPQPVLNTASAELALLKKDPATIDDAEKAQRSEKIKEILVKKYFEAKDKKKKELFGDTGADSHAASIGQNADLGNATEEAGVDKSSKVAKGFDKISEYGGMITDIGSLAAGGVADGFGCYNQLNEGGAEGTRAEGNGSLMDNITTTASSGIGVLNGIYGIGRNSYKHHQARKSGNKYAKRDTGFDVAGSVLGTVGSGIGLAGGISGLAGGSDAFGNAMQIGSAGVDVLGSVLGIAKAHTMHGSYTSGINGLDATSKANDDSLQAQRDKYQAELAATEGQKRTGNVTDERKKSLADQKAALKKNKMLSGASKQGAEKLRMDREGTGRGEAWASGIGSLLGLGGAISKVVGGAAGQIAGTILSLAGGITKLVASAVSNRKNAAREKRQEAQKASNKTKMVTDYMKHKTEKVKAFCDSRGFKLSDKEMEQVALNRLGFDVEIGGEQGLDAFTDQIYNKLTEERANFLLENATDPDCKSVLSNLGFNGSTPPQKEDLLAALGA